MIQPEKNRVLVTGGSGFIGTALINDLITDGDMVCSVDVKAPINEGHRGSWQQCDVLDSASFRKIVAEFRPTHLIHLAAETDMKEGGSLESDYPVNCRSAEILASIFADLPLRIAIFVSTQFVCGPEGGLPKNDTDTFPHTRYGESKVVLERAIRARFPWPWVIVRPTYVWGPHNTKSAMGLLTTIASGKYMHPSGHPIVRSYSYVGTVSWYLRTLLRRPDLAGQTIYASDKPEDSYEFVSRLSRAFRGRNVWRVPRLLLKGLAQVGDRLPAIPMNSYRYYNMTTNYVVPWEKTVDRLGQPETDLVHAADHTARWFKKYKA